MGMEGSREGEVVDATSRTAVSHKGRDDKKKLGKGAKKAHVGKVGFLSSM